MPGKRSELFPDHFFPEFQEGESLYSWCSRIHRLSCNQSPYQTSLQLFGDKKSGLRCDFPAPIETLKERTGNFFDAEENLSREKTLFGFFEKFLPQARRNALAEAISNGPFSKIHYALGLYSSLSRSQANLRCCRICLEEARHDSQNGWWKTEEQWPANFICRKHNRLLDSLTEKTRLRLNKDWVLPHASVLHSSHTNDNISVLLLSRLANISEWCYGVLSSQQLDLETSVLRYCYLWKAKQRGLLAMNGEIRLSELRRAWLAWAGDIPSLPDLDFTRDVSRVNGGFIGQLVREYPGVRHPLKHFLLMAYLFDSLGDLKNINDLVTELLREEGVIGVQNNLRSLQGRLTELVATKKLSVNAAAENLGIDVGQATRYLRSADIAYGRRPRIVGTVKEVQLIGYLRRGVSRQEIVDSIGVRPAFLKDYLARNLELKRLYASMCLELKRKEYRQRFLDAVEENPLMSLNGIKAIPGNGYQWLKRNDSAWLAEALPSLWKAI